METTANQPEPQPKQRKWRQVAACFLGFTALGGLLLLGTCWAAAALYFDVRVAWLRAPLAVAYLAGLLAVWILVKGRWRKIGLTAGGFLLVLAWWFLLQ